MKINGINYEFCNVCGDLVRNGEACGCNVTVEDRGWLYKTDALGLVIPCVKITSKAAFYADGSVVDHAEEFASELREMAEDFCDWGYMKWCEKREHYDSMDREWEAALEQAAEYLLVKYGRMA